VQEAQEWQRYIRQMVMVVREYYVLNQVLALIILIIGEVEVEVVDMVITSIFHNQPEQAVLEEEEAEHIMIIIIIVAACGRVA
jgi:hypothetical protein